MWYKNSYRRHLCDMHIEDWDDSFLSKLSPEVYVENLKKAKLQNAMLYLQSHVGLCHYPTKVGTMHRAFRGKEDTMRRIVELCHENGISVTGYYSLDYNNVEYEKHPDWRMLDANGIGLRETSIQDANGHLNYNRYGLCCPNNPDYQTFVTEQIREMSEYFSLEGMFYDMPFWPYSNCYCPHCKARWEREVGTPMPVTIDWQDENWRVHMRKRRQWMGEFTQLVAEATKKYFPGVSIEFNFASAVEPGHHHNCAEPVNEVSDYTGGDLYGGPYRQSFTCKFYHNITRNQPFEYMFSRCTPGLRKHTATKSEDEMLSSVFLTAAHHGATLAIDAIDPDGGMDERVYERLGKVFAQEIPYEKYYEGDLIADIGIYYSMRSKFNPVGDTHTNHSSCVNTLDTMIRNNIAVDITGGYADISRYPVLIAPSLTAEDSYDNGRLLEYVRNGGCLYFTGTDNLDLLRSFVPVRLNGRTVETKTYLAPSDTAQPIFDWYNRDFPMPFDCTCPLVELSDPNIETEVLATLTLPGTARSEKKFVSIHSDPPCKPTDHPAMLYRSFGAGKVIWSALPLENETMYDYRNTLVRLIDTMFSPAYTVIATAPKTVELVSFRTGNSILVSCVHLFADDYAETFPGFEIRVTCDEPTTVQLLPDETSVPHLYENDQVIFRTRDLHLFDMYRIVFT